MEREYSPFKAFKHHETVFHFNTVLSFKKKTISSYSWSLTITLARQMTIQSQPGAPPLESNEPKTFFVQSWQQLPSPQQLTADCSYFQFILEGVSS